MDRNVRIVFALIIAGALFAGVMVIALTDAPQHHLEEMH